MKAKIFNIQKFCLHDGTGIRTSVFFQNCNLRCKWCANPECYLQNSLLGEATQYDMKTLLEEVLKDRAFYDKSGGGVTLTGGEIFMQFDFVKNFCKLLKENHLNITIETAGACDIREFQELADLVDFIYIDCKHFDPQKHKEGTGLSNELILKNIEWLAGSQKAYRVRIPVIPGYNDSLSDAQGFCALFHKKGVKNIELLPFHQFGESKYEKARRKYAYAGMKQLHAEDLQPYFQLFLENQFNVIMN